MGIERTIIGVLQRMGAKHEAYVLLGISALFVSVLAAQQPKAPPHGEFEEPRPVEQSPFSSQPIEFGNPNSAITTPGLLTVSRERLRHVPSKLARKEFERGMKAKSQRRIEEAVQHFSRAVELQPAYWEALTALADLYWRGGDPAGALRQLDRAAAIDPDVEPVHSNRAVAL